MWSQVWLAPYKLCPWSISPVAHFSLSSAGQRGTALVTAQECPHIPMHLLLSQRP